MDLEVIKRLFDKTAVRIMACVSVALGVALLVAFLMTGGEPITIARPAPEKQKPDSEPAGQEVVSVPESTVEPMAVSAAEVPAVPTPPPGEVSITISAAGNCTFHINTDEEDGGSFKAAYDEHGPEWFLSQVRDVFSTDDLSIVNFEGVLSTGGEREDKTYAFRADPEYAKILSSGSVEAADLANNHAFDYAYEAYEDTKAALDSEGILSFGYDRSQVIEIKGIKIGLVGIFEVDLGLDCRDLLMQEIETCKSQGAQLIIVSFHWGEEGTYDLTENQIELAHAAIDAGANLILGHHADRVQGVGTYNGVHICYGLGNFVFGGNYGLDDFNCMIFRQTFTFSDGVLQDDDEYLVIPARITSDPEYNNYQPVILEGEEAAELENEIAGLL